jgi:hypothetical protein
MRYKEMNYFIYLGIFMVGGLLGVVVMSLVFLGKLGTSIDRLLGKNYQQNKIDERWSLDYKKNGVGVSTERDSYFP